jgi:hypothetical protein
MCNPIISAGISAASQVLQIVGESQATDEYNRSQARYYKETAEAANQNARNQYYALSLRQQQEAAKASREAQNAQKQSRAAQATALAAAADSGTSGNSVDMLIADYARSEADYRDAVLQNLEMTTTQLENEKQSVFAQTKSTINAAKPQFKSKPGLLGSVLKIGLGAGQSYLDAGGKGSDIKKFLGLDT